MSHLVSNGEGGHKHKHKHSKKKLTFQENLGRRLRRLSIEEDKKSNLFGLNKKAKTSPETKKEKKKKITPGSEIKETRQEKLKVILTSNLAIISLARGVLQH